MYNYHLQLKPLSGVSGQEPTAFTKKTIKQLLEEEAAENEAAKNAEAEIRAAKTAQAPVEKVSPTRPAPKPPETEPAPKPVLQAPPSLQNRASKPRPAAPEAQVAAPVVEAEAPEQKPRSFLKRLIGS